MIESLIPISIAVVSGISFLFQRVHCRINVLDKRVDKLELRIAEYYVTKSDFAQNTRQLEAHMERIETKLDKLITTYR